MNRLALSLAIALCSTAALAQGTHAAPDTGATSNIVLTQFTVSTVIVFVLQALKKWKYFPWLNEQSKRVTRVVAAIASAAAGVGIHAQWNHAAGVLTISGLSLTAVVSFLWIWLKSHAMQEGIYRLYQVTNVPLSQLLELLKQLPQPVPSAAAVNVPAAKAAGQ